MRRAFFESHLSGPDRRKYIQEYQDRKKKFDISLKEAYLAKRQEWDDKIEASRKKNNEAEIEFKKQLDQNLRPAADLWPRTF